MTISALVGLWVLKTCVHTVISDKKFYKEGYIREQISIDASSAYELRREWYSDSACQKQKSQETEVGKVELGKMLKSVPAVQEIDFIYNKGKAKGSFSLKGNELKLSHGFWNDSRDTVPFLNFEKKLD